MIRFDARDAKALLAVGFFALAFAILWAYASPANGYEASIYRATPLPFWLGAGLAVSVAVVTLLFTEERRTNAPAVLLAGTAMTAIAALPLIRNYHYYGASDALAHLGHARAISGGIRDVFSVLYPGAHSLGLFLHDFVGYEIPRAMMLVVLCFVLVYFLFVPLAVRNLVPDSRATTLAAYSAFLLLPINNVGVHRQFHPFTLATLFLPVVLYLLAKADVPGAVDRSTGRSFNSVALVLPIVTTAIVLFHPLVAADVIVLFAGITAVQLFARWRWPHHRVARSRAIYGQLVFLVVVFMLWNSQHWQMAATLERFVASVMGIGGSSETGVVVQDAGESATDIGVSLTELFVKMFTVQTIYILLAGSLVASKLFGGLREPDPHGDTAITLFAFGGATLLPFAVLHVFGSVSHLFFRHLGLGMVLATILGAIALYHGSKLSIPSRSRRLWPMFAVIAVALLVVSVLVWFPSPYVYKANPHITGNHMDGHQDSFVTGPSDYSVYFGGVRVAPSRERAALAGELEDYQPRTAGHVTEEAMLNDLVEYYEHGGNLYEPILVRDNYLIVTQLDRDREVVAYRELRYSQESFEAVSHQERVHRVRDRGEFELYYIDLPDDVERPDDIEPPEE